MVRVRPTFNRWRNLELQHDYLIFFNAVCNWTRLDTEDVSEVRAKILSINNIQLGQILRIDTKGLCYGSSSAGDTFYLIEAEQTPGRIENSDAPKLYLKETEFLVEIELL